MGPRRQTARRALRRITRTLLRLRGPVWPTAFVPPAPPRSELAACRCCNGELVCPMDWGTADDSHWWVLARCGECEAWMEIVIDDREAAALDRALDRQLNQIRRAADRLDAERMAADAEAFAVALQRDLIVAADF
jgi:hypothetical protein